MLSAIEQKVCNRVLDLEEELVEVTKGLVRINTADPPGDNYDRCANFISSYLQNITEHTEIAQVPLESLPQNPSTGKLLSRPNVLAKVVGCRENGPVLHFNGHYDVVPAVRDWSFKPYQPKVKEGRLYGRGSSDMKGGIAAVMVAAKALKLENIKLSGTMSFSFVPDEEYGKPAGTKFLVEERKVSADYCIVAEPSGGMDFFNGHKGSVWLEVNTYGKAAHSSMPWKGVNAFDKMVKLVQEINTKIKPSLLDEESIDVDEQTAGKKGTLTLGGRIVTGDSINVIPARCTMSIDRRVPPGEDVNEIIASFSSILESLKQADQKFSGDIKVLIASNARVTPLDSRLVNVVSELLTSVTGRVPEISMMMTGCDMRYFHSAGVSTVIYGPGNLLVAHQADEYVGIKELVITAQIYALAAMRLCLPIFKEGGDAHF